MSNLLNQASGIVTVTSDAGDKVKGPWAELIPSTVRQSGWARIYLVAFLGSSATEYIFDIGLGLAGVEVPTICNLGQMNDTAIISIMANYWNEYSIPWFFDVNQRLSIRVADENVGFGLSYRAAVRLFESPK